MNIFTLIALEFDPVLIVCFEGLLETDHPYSFAAKQCVIDLLSSVVE